MNKKLLKLSTFKIHFDLKRNPWLHRCIAIGATVNHRFKLWARNDEKVDETRTKPFNWVKKNLLIELKKNLLIESKNDQEDIRMQLITDSFVAKGKPSMESD